jgi:3-deoxy-D-arabino-heptulosonate 7-phosphate (DAHP) synthase class II
MPKKLQQENKNKVPASQWRKWPDIAQRVFNSVHEAMEQNPALFVDSEFRKIAAKQWGPVAWNAAWIAADATLVALKDIEKGIGYHKGEKV